MTLPGGDGNVAAALFSEELGAVLQVEATATDSVLAILAEAGLDGCATVLGCVVDDERIEFHHAGRGGPCGVAHGPEGGLVGDQFLHAGAARQPGVRRRGVRARD